MIQEFKIKNYKSFRDEVTLSFEATKDTTFENTQVVEVANGVRLLRLALIYGANASGKSNLLEAFSISAGSGSCAMTTWTSRPEQSRSF